MGMIIYYSKPKRCQLKNIQNFLHQMPFDDILVSFGSAGWHANTGTKEVTKASSTLFKSVRIDTQHIYIVFTHPRHEDAKAIQKR